ncbi:hypothetical protein CRENBAI_018592 [Crenichthys baileyi]|uniref:Uncharacterized protein n=1 Tax=Crenichthys baileyi TaxID=28760 RepID=A0AAV9QWU8_9TELE
MLKKNHNISMSKAATFKMVKSLNLYSTSSSPQRPQSSSPLQSSTHPSTPTSIQSSTHSHTDSGDLHCIHSCPGESDRSEAAIQSAPPGPLTTIIVVKEGEVSAQRHNN